MTTKNGNGNGNGNGHGKNGDGAEAESPAKARAARIAAQIRTDESSGHIIIDDIVPASVLLMFFIQKLGKASFDQIKVKTETAGVVMDPHLMEQGIQALQARQFVSYAQGKMPGTGNVVGMWKPRKANFSGTPDAAQVDQAFLAALVTTQAAEELLDALNDAEEEGDGRSKAKEKLRYADYYMARITFEVIDMLLGGRPSSPGFDELVKKGPKAPDQTTLRFPRDGQGWPTIPMSNIRGWLASGLRQVNNSEGTIDYVSISGGRINFDPPEIVQWAQPVVDLSGAGRGAGGRGITTYECIRAGATIVFTFTIPKRGLFTYDQFVAWIAMYALQSARGLSNSRSNEYGHVQVIDAQYLGETRMAKTIFGALAEQATGRGRAFIDSFVADLGQKDLDLFKGKHTDVD